MHTGMRLFRRVRNSDETILWGFTIIGYLIKAIFTVINTA